MSERVGPCPTCGRQVRAVVPAGGDGSARVYVRHVDHDGQRCDRSRSVIAEDAWPR